MRLVMNINRVWGRHVGPEGYNLLVRRAKGIEDFPLELLAARYLDRYFRPGSPAAKLCVR